MKIKNISVLEYMGLQDQSAYSFLSSINAKNSFLGKVIDPDTISYGKVRAIEDLLKKGAKFDDLYKIFNYAYDIDKHSFLDAPIVDFFQSERFIRELIEGFLKIEAHLLKNNDVDAIKWQQAGGDRLQVYNSIMPLSRLGEIYSIYPFDLENRPYNEIIYLLSMHNENDAVKKAFSKIK